MEVIKFLWGFGTFFRTFSSIAPSNGTIVKCSPFYLKRDTKELEVCFLILKIHHCVQLHSQRICVKCKILVCLWQIQELFYCMCLSSSTEMYMRLRRGLDVWTVTCTKVVTEKQQSHRQANKAGLQGRSVCFRLYQSCFHVPWAKISLIIHSSWELLLQKGRTWMQTSDAYFS